MKIAYKPSFIRLFKKLPDELQEEARDKIGLFKQKKNHKKLRVHPLFGKLKGFKSFSVNYKYRIIFKIEQQNTAVLMLIGSHDIYK